MLRHVVLLRLTEGTPPEHVEEIVGALRELPGRIPELRSYTVGRDLGLAPTNADLIVVADLDDDAAYARYRDHPAHRRVLDELISPVLAERSAVQFLAGTDAGAT